MEWIAIVVVLLALWVWWDGLGAKEIAHKESKRLCKQNDVLFLDDTVAISRLRLTRHRSGRLGWYRRFVFEFTVDGEERYKGYVDMFGKVILATHMDIYRI